MAETIELPAEIVDFDLPMALQARLESLLNRQDDGEVLSVAEREEAEGLVAVTDFLTLLRLRAHRIQR